MPVIDKDIAQKILDRDVLNLVNRARDGRPLTPAQRRTIADYAGLVERREIVDALQQARELFCPDCAPILDKLLANLADG